MTETALTTALNTSYLAEQISLFGIVVGIALLLSGFGFGILAMAGALRSKDALVHLPQPQARGRPARPGSLVRATSRRRRAATCGPSSWSGAKEL